jgi:hypothetical protein
LRRPKATASAAQAPPPPLLVVDQKDRLRQAARPPPCQPGRNSKAARASAERPQQPGATARGRALLCLQSGPWQSERAARWHALPQSATPARAQQHGGVRFCKGPTPARAQQHASVRFCRAPRQPEHNSTPACASAERQHASQSTTARQRALPQSATSAEHNSTAARASASTRR